MRAVFVRGNTLDSKHVSLNDLVLFTYRLGGVPLSGTAWADQRDLTSSDLLQLIAKVSADPPPPPDSFRKMLQPVRADRFQAANSPRRKGSCRALRSHFRIR